MNKRLEIKNALIDFSTEMYQNLKVFEDVRQLHEDAISSLLLKKLMSIEKSEIIKIACKSFKVNESETGMDFQICINIKVKQDEYKSLLFLVQAKSFGNNKKTDEYYNKIACDQCEKIINHARDKKAIPMYFLYQYINDDDDDDDLKENHFKFLTDFRTPLSSITFTSAENLSKILENKEENKISFKDIHKNETSPIIDLNYKFEENCALPLYTFLDYATLPLYENYSSDNQIKDILRENIFFSCFSKKYVTECTNPKTLEDFEKINDDSEIQTKNLIIITINGLQEIRGLKIRDINT